MFDRSWTKVFASLEESPIAAAHFARILFATRDSLPTEADREMLDALIGALFPYTFFGDACRHLFWQYLRGRLDPADDPISAACYYPIWPRAPHDSAQSQNERNIHIVWKMSGRNVDIPNRRKNQIELSEKSKVMRHPTRKPKYLAVKLLAIRQTHGASQCLMAQLLQLQHYSRISDYERGRRTPSAITLLHYSRIAGVPLEHIVDDDIDLDTFKKEIALA